MAADNPGFGVFDLPLRLDFVAAQLAHGFGHVQHSLNVRL